MSELSQNGSFGHIHLKNINLHLGQDKQRFQALDHVSFDIQAGEFVCLLGPSGCGKSTLLGALAGHLPISSGTMLLDQKEIAKPSSDRGLVFQQHTLFPWKSVLENVCFGLKMKGVAKAERVQQAQNLIELVGLKGFEHKYPAELSGGMQQRVGWKSLAC